MKRFILSVILLISVPFLSFALDMDTWLSSNTATADSLKNLCPGQTYVVQGSTYTSGNRGVFHGACINAGIAGTLSIYNSSATATVPIASISTSTPMPCSLYDVSVSSGLTYSNSAAGANVTILYQCY